MNHHLPGLAEVLLALLANLPGDWLRNALNPKVQIGVFVEMFVKTKLVSIVTVAVMTGCATAPFSYIDGNRYHRAEMNSYSVIVLDVDGRSDTRNPVMVDPGPHVIRVQGPPAAGFRYGETRSLTLDVKPCTRYYLKAVKKNSLDQDFAPQVDYVEPIAGCAT